MTAEEKTESTSPELVEINIDGRKMQAPKGHNLLQFMLDAGIEISYFCYHPGLSVVAVCRQCLVGLANAPKLVPACQSVIAEGMEVDNSSAKVLEARRQLLEFTLLNHPIDCPICDKAGECILQKHYMDYNHEPSRVDIAKLRKPKQMDVGPRIILDNERCILCTRCVRFLAEVMGDPQLVICRRGSHSELTVAPGRTLDSPYSLNTVDICPVGALTDKDFRFKQRVWDLSATISVCNGCSTGCPVEIHHHFDRICRLVPRRFKDINLNWMCDFGRYTYKAVAEDRILVPRIKDKELGWDKAIMYAADKLRQILEQDRGSIAVALGADATNEDNYVAAALAFDFLEAEHVYLAAEPDGQMGDSFLRSNDPNPNRAGAMACGRGKVRSSDQLDRDLIEGKLKALYVVGDRLHLSEEGLARAASLDLLAVQATHTSSVVERAHAVLPAAMWPEIDGTITNRDSKVQRLRAAVAMPDFVRPHWQILIHLARRAGLTLDYSSELEIFEAMQQNIDFFANASWGKQMPAVLLRYATSRG